MSNYQERTTLQEGLTQQYPYLPHRLVTREQVMPRTTPEEKADFISQGLIWIQVALAPSPAGMPPELSPLADLYSLMIQEDELMLRHREGYNEAERAQWEMVQFAFDTKYRLLLQSGSIFTPEQIAEVAPHFLPLEGDDLLSDLNGYAESFAKLLSANPHHALSEPA
jgi:hypothetical protein